MAGVVVDASAVAALLFNEPGAETVARRVADHPWLAPALLVYEIASVAVAKARSKMLTERQVDAAMSVFADADLTLHSVDAHDVRIAAMKTGLSAYDAAYWWLAHALHADLVTLDRGLARAFAAR